MKRNLISGILFWLALATAPATQQNGAAGDLQVLPVRGGIYMVAGAGGNVTLQIGQDGVLIVDSGLEAKTDQLLAVIRTLTDKPIRWIINTHVHADHTGGNGALSRAGSSVPQIAIGAGRLFTDAEEAASIVSHENVARRMVNAPRGNLPLATFFVEEKELFFNGEAIQLIHQPAAHTDGDIVVFFRRSDVVAAGDLFVFGSYPVIDAPAGGTFGGYLNALNHLIHIAIPEEKQEGGTYVVPGHGRLADEADVVDVRDMATIVRERIQALITSGKTLEQIKASRPTLDYDDLYRAAGRSWTPDMFVDAVYRSLSGQAKRGGS